jgi:hypothetical protein
MRQIAILLLVLLASGSAWSAEACRVTEQQLLGSWSRSGDAGFFEEFSLASSAGSRTFSSWRDQRPELSDATWSLKNCELIVTAPDGEFPPFKFKADLRQGTLRLYDETDHMASVYTRVPD